MTEHDPERYREARIRLLGFAAETFPLLTSELEGISKEPSFGPFLADYRGLASAREPDEQLQAKFGEIIVNFFASLVTSTGFASAAATAPLELLSTTLRELEETINLGLYYWHAQDDRNFQFRTVVHFCGLEGLGGTLFTSRDGEWYVSLSEHGVRFGRAEQDHIPRMAPMVNALGLEEFRTSDVDPTHCRRLFARLRTIQREICLLEEEWEHRNALLAVGHSRLREEFRRHRSEEAETALKANSDELGRHRDFLASWCLSSFAALEDWLHAIEHAVTGNADLASEWETVHTVILSGLQKIFLPASVSRHQYSDEVARKFLRWCEARLKLRPDDASTALLAHSLRLHLGMKTTPPRAVVQKKPFEWSLPYDPTAGLKSFCWRHSRAQHLHCTALATIAVARKLNPDPLNEFWVVNMASLLEMPATYLSPQPSADERPTSEALEAFQLAADAVRKAHVGEDFSEDVQALIRSFEQPEGATP